MKTKLLTTVIVAATFAAALQLNAQFRPATDDGIAASPKVRQTLDERAASKRVASIPAKAVAPANCCSTRSIAASPKVAQMLKESASCCKPACCVATR